MRPRVRRRPRRTGIGTAQNECRTIPEVSYQEIYAGLQRFEHRWVQLATALTKRPGGGTITATARFRCNARRLYAYRTEAFAYSVVKGVGYTSTSFNYDNLAC